jgi:hypothetical protein
MGSKQIVRLSAQEVLDCDHSSQGCKGGTANRVLTWGKRKGFVPEDCYTKPVVEASADNTKPVEQCSIETL